MPFAFNRESALLQLEDFVPRLGRHYSQHRNFDEGPSRRQNVSMLSAPIRKRLVSEAEVLQRVFEAYSFSGAEKFIQEVLWRTYWKGWLEMRPQVWSSYRNQCQKLGFMRENASYKAATSARTGIECFDFWVNELIETGYLHNHARMWFASIWIFGLDLPWELGAEFFYRYLLDGDPASNTLSWRWVAGLQTLGKQYLVNAGNIEKFSQFSNVQLPRIKGREFRESLDRTLPEPLQLSRFFDLERYKNLLIHPEDLSPETSEIKNWKPKKIFIISLRNLGLSDRLDQKVLDFDEKAIEDTARRSQLHFGVPVNHLKSLEELGSEATLSLAAPLGEVQEKLTAHPNISFAWRNWDVALYPRAQTGFFGFKKGLEIDDLKGLCSNSLESTQNRF